MLDKHQKELYKTFVITKMAAGSTPPPMTDAEKLTHVLTVLCEIPASDRTTNPLCIALAANNVTEFEADLLYLGKDDILGLHYNDGTNLTPVPICQLRKLQCAIACFHFCCRQLSKNVHV